MSACQLAVQEVPSEKNLHRSMLCDREWGGGRGKKEKGKGKPTQPNPTEKRLLLRLLFSVGQLLLDTKHLTSIKI